MRKFVSSLLLLSFSLVSQQGNTIELNPNRNIFECNDQARYCGRSTQNCNDHHTRRCPPSKFKRCPPRCVPCSVPLVQRIQVAIFGSSNPFLTVLPGANVIYTDIIVFFPPVDATSVSTNGTFTINQKGTYIIDFSATYLQGTTGQIALIVSRNGVERQVGQAFTNSPLTITSEVKLRQGDVLSFRNIGSTTAQVASSTAFVTQIKPIKEFADI